jgi:glycosyltransferase involved in cell wall biosynthesis
VKNITLITHGAHGGHGGIDKYVRNIIDVISKTENNFNVNVYSKNKVFFNKENVSTKFSKNNFFFLILRNIIDLIRSDLIIVTHINLILYLFFLIFNKKKIILFSYGLEIWGGKKNILYRIFIKKINYFVCMRRYTMNIQKKIYNIKPLKEYLLKNTLDKIFNKALINERKQIILTVARLDKNEKYKGIDETLEAMSLIKKINFKYYIIGDGDDRERLSEKAKKLNINKNVIFTGRISDQKRDKILKFSKICIMPGTDKTFDTYPYRFSFLEAASHGLHIIGSNPTKLELSGAKKYKNFNFVNAFNRKEIAQKIIQLLKKKNLFCANLRKDFSFDTFNVDLNVILKKILNN